MLDLNLNKNVIIMLDKPYWPERFVGISISEERAPGGVFKRWGVVGQGCRFRVVISSVCGEFYKSAT